MHTYVHTYTHTHGCPQEWLKRNPDFAHFIASQEARPECCGLTLPALLITPIQRTPRSAIMNIINTGLPCEYHLYNRYKLLLEDLLKHTKTTHPDYPKLSGNYYQVWARAIGYFSAMSHLPSAASAQIAAVATHINEHIRQHENFKKMLSIQQCLSGPCVPGILAPGRKFLQQGRLMKVHWRERGGGGGGGDALVALGFFCARGGGGAGGGALSFSLPY